ncbi:MAG: pullulanase, type [Ferruginibacter sp.]|nr:pullulanase, type [Ferruginibacter sp.]
MKKLLLILTSIICLLQKTSSQALYQQYPVYNGTGLGLSYTPARSLFRIWSPTAEEARLLLYRDGEGGNSFQTTSLLKGESGTWWVQLPGDLKKTFYTFQVKINNRWSDEVTDPYVKAVGVNGRRGMVIDLAETNPAGWSRDKSPVFSKNNQPTDAVIYELHIRDASIHLNSGIAHKGKFAGLAETGTVNQNGMATGLDHLKELGVTHVHLLPFYDFSSVDESSSKQQYNWGYDPLNYNVPEGSFSSNPYDGVTRIKELKQMISAFHQKGLRVVMDVVFNHTARSENSNFNQLVPGYYYRHKKDGNFSNATACGNETASDMPMMRKFMLESVLYWVKEYHIDGFRFDLMGVHDIETMNTISKALNAVKPGILLYGEGWTAGESPLPDSLRALKKNVAKLNGVAVFSDDLRDGIKGSVFDLKENGFVSGKASFAESVKFGIVASCKHPQVNYAKVNYAKAPYANSPGDVITYCECHDNNVLWDKLVLSNPGVANADLKRMHRLALTIVLTSQGIPFLHAGTEFMRSKKGVENSYNSGDSINAIDWSLKTENIDLTRYVEQLIRMRKMHPSFRMTTAAQIRENIHFDGKVPVGTIAYTINGTAMKDSWKNIWIAFNGTSEEKTFILPAGNWKNALQEDVTKHYEQRSVQVGKYSAAILFMD